jgi:hypothetical protein
MLYGTIDLERVVWFKCIIICVFKTWKENIALQPEKKGSQKKTWKENTEPN